MKKRIIILVSIALVLISGACVGLNAAVKSRKENERIAEEKRIKEERIEREKKNSLEAEKERQAAEKEAEEKKQAEADERQAEREAKRSEIEKKKADPRTKAESSTNGTNCSLSFGKLMLINPNFTVSDSWIASRKAQLISVSKTYGIKEGNKNNGDNLLDKEAAAHLKSMVEAYEAYNSGHTMVTRSCFRSKGTTCGRLCAKTGTSDHHTGYTCDLIDTAYGDDLDTAHYEKHKEWQWLRENSYKFGFIDRFPADWAGGPMSKPANVDANGTTGLYETWHYRYVGAEAATEIAKGKYNNGKYDSLEHYLKAKGWIINLVTPKCR